MSNLDDYLGGGEDTSKVSTPPIVPKERSLDQYLSSEPVIERKGRLLITPKPPISDATPEESAAINAQPSQVGGVNPRESYLLEGIRNLPSNIAQTATENAVGGYNTFGQGVADISQGNIARGLVGVGVGGLQMLTTPATTAVKELVERPVTELTGSPDIGARAGIVAGSALPIVPGAKLIADNLPRTKALKELVNQITSGGRDPQALVDTINAMKADSRVAPVDKSPAVLANTQELFTLPGDATKNYLFNASKNRVANLASDVTGAYDAAGGVPVNVVQKLAGLAAASKAVGENQINPIVKAAKPVDITNTLAAIDNTLKPGITNIVSGESALPLNAIKGELKNIRNYLASKTEMRTGAEDLHKFQSGLRVTGQRLLKSAGGSDRELGHALLNIRENLKNDIEASAPGYKEALGKYHDEREISDAFHNAYNSVFSNSTKMENMPEFTEKWFNALTDNEKEAAKEGARLAIRSKMGVSGNPSLAGTNLAKSEFNQKKLEILFGKNETEKLLRDLENTRAIKNTDQKIIEGSQTAVRQSGNQNLALPQKGEGGSTLLNYALPIAGEYATTMMGQPGLGALLGGAAVGAKAAGSAANFAIKTKLAKERNLQFAKLALPTEGPSRDQLIRDLEKFIPSPKPKLSQRLSSSLMRLTAP